ncbi:MAG: hypothetical protein JXR70_16135 [Spirochaetales bacterium]|nr:hypothetical protein [Spirochaetales bacterium]
MKKKFMLICLLLFVFTALGAQIRVLYKCLETNKTTSQIRFNFSLRNDGSTNVNLNGLAVRYYHTEGPNDQNIPHLDYSPIGDEAIVLSHSQAYLEMVILSDVMIGPDSTLGEFQLRLSKGNWSSFYQADDYSFLPDMTTIGENPKMPLYQGQELLWGNPPVDYENFFYINLTGADEEEVYVSTWGSENSTVKLPAQFPQLLDLAAELSQIDIPRGQLGGKFLWTIDGLYSDEASSEKNYWIFPIERKRGGELNVEYKDYDEIIEMPTLPPEPTSTPSSPFWISGRVIDGLTGELFAAPGLEIQFISAKDLEKSILINEAEFDIGLSFHEGYDYYLEISAPGYHRAIKSVHSSKQPVEFVLYPEVLNTPLPESKWIYASPYATEKPLPENPGTWYLSLVDVPPEMDFYNDDTIKAHIKVPFFPAAARALDWGEARISGNQIVINAQLVQWDGPAPMWDYNLEHSYDLGQLDMSVDYEIQLHMWDQPIWTYSLNASDIQEYEAPMDVSDYYDPHFKTRWFWKDGNRMELSALLYDCSTYLSSLESWGEPQLEGSIIKVEPVIFRTKTGSWNQNLLRSVSNYYDLSAFPAGDYSFQVMMNGHVFLSEELSLSSEMPPHVTEPPNLNYSMLSSRPIIEILSVPDTVAYPQTSFDIEIVNYGVAGEIVLNDLITDYPLSYSKQSFPIARGEKRVIEAFIDWNQVSLTGSRLSYNGFVVKSDSIIREIRSWRVELINNQSDSLSISGKAELDVSQGVPVIHLSGDAEKTTRPDINGNYSFDGLQPGGDYLVSLEYIPNKPVIEILSPKAGVTLDGTVKVQAKVSTPTCSVLYSPETIQIANLKDNVVNQDFMISDYADCCVMIDECYVSIDSVKIAQSLNTGMCQKEYLFYLDMHSYLDKYYDINVAVRDELGRITNKSVQIYNRPDPSPTPTPECCFSSSFFEPLEVHVPPNHDFSLDFKIVTASYHVLAYQMVFEYDPDFLTLDPQKGSDAIEAGEAGFISEFTNNNGILTITGFDTNGTGPSNSEQEFLKFHFTTGEKSGVTRVEIKNAILLRAEAFEPELFKGALATVYIGTASGVYCPYQPGDADGNGVVNIIDALLIAQYYVGIPGVVIEECAADVDNPCQGPECTVNINIVDALLVAKYYVGLITEF